MSETQGNPKRQDPLSRLYSWLPWTLWLLLTLGTTALFPRQSSFRYSEYTVGSISREEIIAPFTFEILKSDEELAGEREQAREAVEPVFLRVDSVRTSQIAQLRGFWRDAGEIAAELARTTAARRRNSLNLDSLRQAELDTMKARYGVNLSPQSWAFLLRHLSSHVRAGGEEPPLNRADLETLLNDLFGYGILDRPRDDVKASRGTVRILHGGEERSVALNTLYDVASAREEALARLRDRGAAAADSARADTAVKVSYELLLPYIVSNLVYDEAETESRREAAVARVPLVKGIVLKDERIIDSNEKITRRHLDVLRSMEIKRAEMAAEESFLGRLLPWVGRFLLAGLIYGLFGVWLARFRRDIYGKPNHLLLVSLLMALIVAFYGLVVLPLGMNRYLFPGALLAIILTIVFDGRLALLCSFALAMIATALTGNDYFVFLGILVPAVAAIFPVLRVRTRVQIMRSSLSILGACLLVIVIQRQLTYQWNGQVFHDMFYAAGVALATPLVALGMLIAIEALFGVTTDLTLLELADLNRPLLKRLSLEAPGTYHHSIMVGNLAEAAAEAIEANPLLVRAGAYYHDIGKMARREYFVENQTGLENVHDKLEPEESAAVLSAHVTDGVKLADRYRLPEVIKSFIREHHGTSLMVYFYKRALDMRPEGSVDEGAFRYPGPKPQSRETGILMLADAAEAATRSLDDPTPENIGKVVRDVVINKYRDGELDACPLTMRDIRLIIDAFVPILQGMHHHRIRYPSREELERLRLAEGRAKAGSESA